MTRRVKLGIMGLGTVGSSLVTIIERQREALRREGGVELEVVAAVVRNLARKRACDTQGIRLSTSHEDVLLDDSIDIVVEVMGGVDTAYAVIRTALERGKSVVTANKALIAQHGEELLALARSKGVALLAEASVGGGIPILKTLRESMVANTVKSLAAIINGTTNFILTKMDEEGLSYFEALKIAGDLGFAEADPTLDVEGIDAQQKLKILAAHISGGRFPQGEILCEGISQLSDADFRFARNHGFSIKLLALGRRRGERLELRVHPTLVSRVHPLASVRNEFNAIYIDGDAVGQLMLSGRGAGGLPTASSVYADIVDICTRTDTRAAGDLLDPPQLVPSDEIESEYYLRFTIEDKPGVIGEMSTILGRHDISVSSVAAELIPNAPELGEVEIMVHRTSEARLAAAMKEINSLSRVKGRGRFIRIERELG